MSKSATWQHRKASSDAERFGLLDNPNAAKYRRMPVFQEPIGELPSMRPLTAFGITSGVGSMLIGPHRLGYKVVGNVEWRDYYRYRRQTGDSTFCNYFPGAFNARGLNDVPKNMLPGSIDLALGHPECLMGETKVYTSTGWQRIKNIRKGDLVLTHNRRFRPVIKTFKNFLPKSEWVELSLSGAPKKGTHTRLNLTVNHPVLTSRGWVTAGEVLEGDTIKLLSRSCLQCGKPIPFYKDFCSVSEAVQYQWDTASEEERKALTTAAHERTRERCKDGSHQFHDPVVRSNAMKKLSASRSSSNLERILEWGMKEVGLPEPTRQHPVGRFFIDFAFPEQKIAIEADGVFWHNDESKEKARDAFLEEQGWTVLHFAEDRIRQDAIGCAQETLRVLSNHSGDFHFIDMPILSVRSYQSQIGRTVYNLGVLDDHSYVAKGFVVHNCGRYSSLSHSVVAGNGQYQATRGEDVSDLPMFLKLVAELEPRFFLMDDLPDSFGPLPMSEYIKILPGYDLFPEWISNWGYGNIQKHRNRMFIVGAKKSEGFVFVPGEEEHGLVLRDAISRFLEVPAAGAPNHAFVDPAFVPGRYVNMRWYGERSSWGDLAELFKTGDWGKNLKYYSPAGEQKVRPGTTNPKWDGFCPVLSGGYNPIHPIRRSPLSIRERAAIQGFPDDFLFHHDEEGPFREVWEPYNSDGQRGIKQTGKSMPLQFTTYVAAQVQAFINRDTFATTGKRILKPNPKVTKAKEDFCRLSGYSNQAGACKQCWHRAECPLFLELKDVT